METVKPRVLRFGDSALLAEVGTLAEVLTLHARLLATAPEGVLDLVPAARTVLVHVDTAVIPLERARAWVLGGADSASEVRRSAPLITLPVVYEGEDLDAVADLLGISVEALIARHTASEWTVAFTGFAPGFGYLVSADWTFEIPRRASPRTRVPAGSIALAGEFTGAYPRDTPGGWQLIGATPSRLFDPRSETPALLAPGARVRFQHSAQTLVGSSGSAERATAATISAATPTTTPPQALTVIETGLLATIQDLGRPGRASDGIALSGAADRTAHRTANRLVGNQESAATVEVTLGGFRAIAERDLWVAVTGAWGQITLNGGAVDPYTATLLREGEELHIDWFTRGVRAYLAIRGGVNAIQTAGSLSTDTLSGLGPARLRIGDALAGGADIAGPVPPDELHPWGAPPDEVIDLELAPGPRSDWFSPSAHLALFETEWRVSLEADRIGIRLDGGVLESIRHQELPSEAMLPGAIQVPPSGQPVILGPDGPVTGGYPVIAVVTDASRDRLAQARSGTRIRFRHAR